MKDAAFAGWGKAGTFQYTFASAPEPQLVDLLLARDVTRPVSESLAADHPDRVRPAIRAVDERLTSDWKPRSLPASLVDAVRNPAKWGYAPTSLLRRSGRGQQRRLLSFSETHLRSRWTRERSF